MSEKVYKIESEWDFGHADIVFMSVKSAKKWLETDINVQEFIDGGTYSSVDEIINDGLISIVDLDVMEEDND